MLTDHPALDSYRAELFSEDDSRYEAAREVAREDIKRVEQLHEEARRAPIWVFDGWDEEGEPIMEENTDPWDRLERARERAAGNPNAVAILRAEGRLSLLGGTT